MKMQKILFLSLAALAAGQAHAQRYFGVATGDYNSVNSVYLNPANIADSKEKISVSIISANVGADNSLGTFSQLSNIGNGSTNTFSNASSKSFSMLIPVAEIRGPGVMIGLNNDMKMSFALTTRVRVINQFNNFDESLYATVANSDHSANQTYTFQTSKFNWTAHLWSEIGLSYALVPYEDDHSQLKAGITVRYLGGIDYLGLKGNNLNVSYTSGSDTFYASHSDLEFASNAISADNAFNNGLNTSNVLGSFLGGKAGSGVGMDIGASYTYKIGEGEDAHLLRASAAVTDIGAIKYKSSGSFTVDVTGNGYLTGKGLSDNIKDYSDFRNYMVGQGFTADTGAKATKVYLPTAMLLSADYQIYHRFYANLTYVANMANRQNYGNSYYNQITLTPRYDTKIFSVGLPITYGSLAQEVKLGIGLRVSGFFFGSDDMLAQHGLNFYFGGYVPICKKNPKGNSDI
jgi:Family of unknown function (DUF5723)